MNLTQLPDEDETTTPASASSVSIAHSGLKNSHCKKKRQHPHKDLNKQPKLIHQLIQPPLDDDDDEDEESDQQENEDSTEEQLALYEFKTHKKMKLNNGEEHTISDIDEQNKYEEDTEEEDDDDDESQESCSSSQTPSENEEQLSNCHLPQNQPEGQDKEIDKEEHKDQGNLCDSMDQSEEEEEDNNEEEDDDEDYVVTEEDLVQHRNDKVLNCLWSEEALKKLEIDELDEPIDEQCDVEGFDVEEVMNDEKKKKYIENLMECLPPYMYCITPEDKQLFFEKLNKEFQHNLEEADTHVARSHEKKVNFDFASAQVIEFDLNKKVKNISKLPILKGVEDVSAI